MEEKEKLIEGVFCANQRGFGFVATEDSDEDYFIPEKFTMHAFHGDKVKIRPSKEQFGQRKEAKIVEIIEHEIKEVVGTYEMNETSGLVIPDNRKIPYEIYIPRFKTKEAKDGQKVVCKITDYGSINRDPYGEITEVIGDADAKGVDIVSLIRTYDIPTDFPEEVLAQADTFPEDLPTEEIARRTDYRSLRTITIDGDDSKDFDDAVSIERDGDDYILGVHIADVSQYVTEDSPLDIEAKKRGTSVYLVDRVVPMLPFRLSDDLCSLMEGKDRPTLSCVMRIDKDGQIIDHKISESVIHSHHRMTYSSVNKILEDEDPEEMAKYPDMLEDLKDMEKLGKILFKKREIRGSIEFDLPEAKIILDDDGHAVDIKRYDRGVSQKMIEEFMLAANETVAEDFSNRKIPFLYRTHDTPEAEKMERLYRLAGAFFYVPHVSFADVTPKQIQNLVNKVKDTDEETFITLVALRSMQRACYTTDGKGHFGLAAPFYCHFTSPIRRYPDLQIHRIIKETLQGKMDEDRKNHYNAILPDVAGHTSDTERRADQLERDTDDLKKAEYLSYHVGEEFEGTISGVVKWGFYVELPNTAEGLVSIRTLTDDDYEYSEDTFELIGRYKNRHFKLGEPVTIKVASVDVKEHRVDFVLPEMEKFNKENFNKKSERFSSSKPYNNNDRSSKPYGGLEKKDKKHHHNKDRKKSKKK